VIELLFWVSVTSLLTPVALSLAWNLISGIGDLIGRSLSWDFEGDEQWGPLRPLSFNPPSGPSRWLAGLSAGEPDDPWH
jgi:hypothetical protein